MPIQTTNVYVTTGDAIEVTTQSQSLTILQGVVVQSDSENSVDLQSSNDQLLNFGILAAADAGVFSEGTGPAFIQNESGATISGEDFGIYTQVIGDRIINNGSISSFGTGIYEAVGSVYIENDANIFGGSFGINANMGDDIVNSGTIGSSGVGIQFVGPSGSATLENLGLIRGSTDALSSGAAGAVVVINKGTLDGNVGFADTGGDTITNKGSIEGNVQLGNGTNTFNSVGGTVTGTITGGSGADTIHLGNDGETVNGGLGHDVIYGGAGADTFEFTSDGAANADGIRNFNVANDIIELSHATFTKLAVGSTPVFSIGTGATSASDHLYYNSTGGGLWYDPDGSGSQAAIEIANLGAGLKLTAKDFTVVA